jgi:hypothetical protein
MNIDENRYKFVTAQQNYLNEKILEAFSQFVTILVTIIGGVIWLRSQSSWPQIWPQTREIASYVVSLLGVQALLRIGINAFSWWGFRKAESAITKHQVSLPRFPRSATQEILLSITIVVATIGAIWLLRALQ